MFQNRVYIIKNLIIPNANYVEPFLFEKSRPLRVAILVFSVLSTIKLNNQFFF